MFSPWTPFLTLLQLVVVFEAVFFFPHFLAVLRLLLVFALIVALLLISLSSSLLLWVGGVGGVGVGVVIICS